MPSKQANYIKLSQITMKIVSSYVQSLNEELDSLNQSWLPSEEIEKIYSPKLVDALKKYKEAEEKKTAFDYFPLVIVILNEISSLEYLGEINCCQNLIKIKTSYLLNIYEAFKFLGINFAVLYHHPDCDLIVKLYSLLLRKQAFSENLTHLLLKKNAASIFTTIIELLHQKKTLSALGMFINFDDLNQLELILKLFEIYDNYKLLDSSIIQTLISHKNIKELYASIDAVIKQSAQISNSLNLLPYCSQPLKLQQSLNYLENLGLRDSKIDKLLSLSKQPYQVAELYQYLSTNKLVCDVFFEKLSYADINLLYSDYFQNPNLNPDEKNGRIFQFFSYFQLSKQEFNDPIFSLIKLIQIKNLYASKLTESFTINRMLELFETSMTRKLSLDITDYKINDVIDCLKRLIKIDYLEGYTEISLKELLTIIYLYYNENPSEHEFFIKLFKDFFYEIQVGHMPQDEAPLSTQETFIHLLKLIDLLHHQFLKVPEQSGKMVFDSLIYLVDINIKSYFASLLTALPKHQCLSVLFIMQENGIPEQIWQLLEPGILYDISNLYPHEKKLQTIVKLGQRAFPPMKELNEMFVNYFKTPDPKPSFFVSNGFSQEVKPTLKIK